MKTPLQFFTGLTLAVTFSVLSPSNTLAQSQKTDKRDIYTFVEQMPEFEGGEAGMMQYIGRNLQYAEGLPGGLLVASFVVNPDSSVSDVAILKGLHPELEQESVRVLESMTGKWVPGKQNGKAVAVRFTLPIRFEESKKKQPDPNTSQANNVADTMPEYKDGIVGMLNFINKNLTYNRANSPEGLSVISFIVHEDGSLSDYKVERSLSPELDAEALRVTKLMSGDWKPGIQRGNSVKVKYTLPIRFTAHKPKEIKQENSRQIEQENPRQLPEKEIQALQGDIPFVRVDQMPAYEGGQEELMRFLHQAVPSSRNQKGLSVFSFVVNRDGSISDVEVLKSIHAATDNKIADALLATSGKWTPGQQYEYKVRVKYTLPLNYPLKKAQNAKVVVSPVGG